ncbi:ankyrin repeat-containing domain protein [Neocallimastix lanati (nom. inval.)]|nr:ankyrin repeat-containing domain protein [Neocallimastix sp. JGI-2020a]
MNKRKKKRDIKSNEYNNNRHTSIRLKTVTNNQENDLYITSSEIKKLIKNSNLEDLKNIFDNSKFYDNEFIKCLLFLYKNKTPIKNLNYEISKDKYKITLNNKNIFIIENENINLLKYLVVHGVALCKIAYKNGEISLFKACESRNIDLVKYLIEHGANINKKNEFDLVAYLVENGADINKKNKYGYTSLLYVNQRIKYDIRKYLLNHGAHIE